MLDKINVANFEKLAAKLETVPDAQFDMREFSSSYDLQEIEAMDCHTVACALGWGPAAGIPVGPNAQRGCGVYWGGYFDAQFLKPKFTDSLHVLVYDWCFHDNWVHVDNTAKGAAKRIRHMLRGGKIDLPSGQPTQQLKRRYLDA